MDRSIRQRAKKVSAGQTFEEERQPLLLGGGSSSPDNKITTDNITFIRNLVDAENFELSQLNSRTIKYAEFKKALTPYERLQEGFDAKKYFKALILADMLKLEWKPDFLSNTDIIHALIEINKEQSYTYVTQLTRRQYDKLINYAKTKRITRGDFDIAFNDYRENAINVQNFENLSAEFRIKWSPIKKELIKGLVNMQNVNTGYGTVDQKTKAFQYAIKKGIQKSEFDEYVHTNALTTLQWPKLTRLQRALKCVGDACKTLTGGGGRV